MSLKFRTNELTPAEASLVAWQFGFQDDDDPFYRSLWNTIDRAWISDRHGSTSGSQTDYLGRLGAPGAFPAEIQTFLKFRADDGERYWLSLLRKADLADRRQRAMEPKVERRRRAVAA